ncbi:MAG: hypothetical protein LLG01_01630 [Planctomycetaceae bacterium]|nr:hypothetical protein [Planctomycetaceae bacterium]
MVSPRKDKNKKARILGVGLDNQDGHVRVTRGKNFELVGGSDETHASMQEKCIKFNEKLDSRGKQLEELDAQELLDIAHQVQMLPLAVRRRQP